MSRNYQLDHEVADELNLADGREVRAVTEEMTIEQLDSHTFEVHSESGKVYTVDTKYGRCECYDHEERGETCKHLRRVTMGRMRPVPDAVAEIPEVARDLSDGEETLELTIDAPTPATVAADGGESESDDEEICGAETQKGTPCQWAAGECPHHGDDDVEAAAADESDEDGADAGRDDEGVRTMGVAVADGSGPYEADVGRVIESALSAAEGSTVVIVLN